jgi:hypothetical protein
MQGFQQISSKNNNYFFIKKWTALHSGVHSNNISTTTFYPYISEPNTTLCRNESAV